MNNDKLEIPLDFLFSRNPWLALPTVALPQYDPFNVLDFGSLRYVIEERPYDKAEFNRIYKKHYRKKTFKFFHLWYEKIYENVNSEFVQKQINASYNRLFNDK